MTAMASSSLLNTRAGPLCRSISGATALCFTTQPSGARLRHYLLRLQSALINEGADYSEALAQKIAQQAQLDLDMFWEDRKSELAIKAFKKDQYMADEMGVTQTATAVVFDSEQPVYGYMINNFDYESLIESYRNHQFCLQQTPEEFAQSFNDKHHQSTLRIL